MMHNNYLITKQRNDAPDDMIFVFTDDAPEWFKDTVRELHDGMMPDDWTFEAVSDVWDSIMEHDDTDDARDASGQIADENTEYRTWHLFEWAKSHTDDIDAACAEFETTEPRTIVQMIQLGQYVMLERFVHVLCDAIDANDDD